MRRRTFQWKKGFFSEKGGGNFQWMRGLVRISTGKAIQWRGSGNSVNRRTLKTEKLLSSPPSQKSALSVVCWRLGRRLQKSGNLPKSSANNMCRAGMQKIRPSNGLELHFILNITKLDIKDQRSVCICNKGVSADTHVRPGTHGNGHFWASIGLPRKQKIGVGSKMWIGEECWRFWAWFFLGGGGGLKPWRHKTEKFGEKIRWRNLPAIFL